MYKVKLFSNGSQVVVNTYTEVELYKEEADKRLLALYKHLPNLHVTISEF